jgi:hypothetical protein
VSGSSSVREGVRRPTLSAELTSDLSVCRVNSTSSLQLNSVLYRFHPSVKWSCGFPHRDEIVGQIRALADRYRLHDKLRLKVGILHRREVGRDIADPYSPSDQGREGHASREFDRPEEGRSLALGHQRRQGRSL